MSPRKPENKVSNGFLKTEGLSLLVLLFSLLYFFKDWTHFTSRVFLSLDLTVIYYPFYHWVHEHLVQGKLPLICDLLYHGAPLAAVSGVGVLSPFLWMFHEINSFVPLFNVLFIAPTVLYLFGTYFLGRRLALSPTASLLLAFLWTYNGHQLAQLDHLNVAWAHAFFPWAFRDLLEYLERKGFLWLLRSALLFSLSLMSGHPQVFFLEGLFFTFWIFLFHSRPWLAKLKDLALFGIFSALFASPLLLFTAECLKGQGLSPWNEVDRFYHSWTPLNFITLVFPWFFGHEQYDRAGGDYWWQYQFVEMQVAFSIVGLFFILLFFLRKHPHRRSVLTITAFAVAMAMGKFFFVYPLVQSFPIFSFFRDPARYWFLATWVLGLGAAWAWDGWFKDEKLLNHGKWTVRWIWAFALGLLMAGVYFLTKGLIPLENFASWAISKFLLHDSTHTQTLDTYLIRLPEKLNALSMNIDIHQPRVFLPLIFLACLSLMVFYRRKWDIRSQKTVLLLLVFVDLMAFRMPLGNAFYDPTRIPGPQFPPAQNRSLTLLYKNVSPLPDQYGEMAYPNWNLISGRPNLALDAHPALAIYDKILSDLGWFSWVYKDRDPLGFSKKIDLLQTLGIDQIVSDSPLVLSNDFRTIQNHYPFVYQLANVSPKAALYTIFEKISMTDSSPSYLQILAWGETHLAFLVTGGNPKDWGPNNLFLQKTNLPGWKAFDNGKRVEILPNLILTVIPLQMGQNQVELKFDPTGLRLGFFLFFLAFAWLVFLYFRRLVA